MAQSFLQVLAIFVCVSLCAFNAAASVNVFYVGKYGAHADGKTNDAPAIQKAWQAACASSGLVKLFIPEGTYYLGPVKFEGPCPNVTQITIEMRGTLKADTNLANFHTGSWLEFHSVKGLRLIGGGTLDGQGIAAWKYNSCSKTKNCHVLPTTMMFMFMNDTIVKGIHSINPKFFHIGMTECRNFRASELTLTAPEDSPNTDGVHIERSSDVRMSNTEIKTGDDCISIGHGNTNLYFSSIKCGPGHGISVGSLGRYQKELDVKGLVVRDSIITGTMNGVRIKTWRDSPCKIAASNMTFENIQMVNVSNPIIIDQNYCPYSNCASKAPSSVVISDIHFNEIRGTSATPVGVTLNCSQNYPCSNVNLQNIQLKYINGSDAIAVCQYSKPHFAGTMTFSKCITA